MEIPKHLKTHEFTSSTVWIDEDGIVYTKPRKDAPPELSPDELEKDMEKFRELIGRKKVCLIVESNKNSKPPQKEERDRIAEIFAEITKAMAIIIDSPLSRMVANLFFGLKPPPYPVKMFSNEKDAKEWIKQHLK